MPAIRDDNAVSFVHGHGAKFSSTPAEKADGMHQRRIVTKTLEFARALAAAQLAYQREAGKKSGQD